MAVVRSYPAPDHEWSGYMEQSPPTRAGNISPRRRASLHVAHGFSLGRHGGAKLLMLLGLAMALLYWFGIAARYPLMQGLTDPGASWGVLAGRSLWSGVGHGAVYTMLLICYVLALRIVTRQLAGTSRSSVLIIVGGWLLSSVVLLWAYPGESRDIFDYLFRGRMLVLWGASPLNTEPAAFQQQPFYNYLSWGGWIDAYGPLWEYASAAVAWLAVQSGGMLWMHVLGYRLLSITGTGLCAVIIWTLAKREAPQSAVPALITWLWNPLLLISTALGAHNDVLMITLILLGLGLFQRERWISGLLLVVLAAHVKLTALILLPVFLVWLLRHKGFLQTLFTSLLTLVLALPLSWLLYQPLGGWATLPRNLEERTRLLVNSLATLIYHALRLHWQWPEEAARRATTGGATLVFALLAGALLLWLWRLPKASSASSAVLWRVAIAVTMLYLVIGSYWFQSWYVLWVLALSALLPRSRWTLVFLPLYVLGALWSNLVSDFLLSLGSPQWTFPAVMPVMVATLLSPLACGLVLWIVYRTKGLDRWRLRRLENAHL